MIRPLQADRDAETVLEFYRRSADYLDLESGRAPSPEVVAEYFADAPPNGDPATSLKLGLFEDGRMIGIADMAFGYPEPTDSYIGLLILAQEARGRGLGARFLRHLEGAARARGAVRMLLAVLEANAKARAFWEREGFGSPRVYPAVPIGQRTHVRIELRKAL